MKQLIMQPVPVLLAISARISERCTGNAATSNRSAMADQDGSGRNIVATYASDKKRNE